MSKKTKVSIVSLIAVMLLPFYVSGDSFADIDRKQKIERLGDKFEKEYLKYQSEDHPKAKSNHKAKMDVVVRHLEKYGITYTEKWQNNKEYWAQKSSEHLDDDLPLAAQENILPAARTYSDPWFRSGVAYECWWVLTCHEWSSSPAQIAEGSSGIDTVGLEEDCDWSEGAWRVTGGNYVVDFNFISKLKDGSITKNSVNGNDVAHLINNSVSVGSDGDRYTNNPQDDWHYSIQYAITNITTLP